MKKSQEVQSTTYYIFQTHERTRTNAHTRTNTHARTHSMIKATKQHLRQVAYQINNDAYVKPIYIQQIYRIKCKKNNRYLFKLSNHTYIHLHIGVTVEYWVGSNIQPSVHLLKGDDVDGFGKCMKKYLKGASIASILPCVGDDRNLIISTYHGRVGLKIDCFGTGRATIRLLEHDQIVGSWAGLKQLDIGHNLVHLIPLSEFLQIKVEAIEIRNRMKVGSSSCKDERISFGGDGSQLKRRLKKQLKKLGRKTKCPREQIHRQYERKLKLSNELRERANQELIRATETNNWSHVSTMYGESKNILSKANRAKAVLESKVRIEPLKEGVGRKGVGREDKLELEELSFNKMKRFRFAYSPNNILVLGTKNAGQVGVLIRNHFTKNHIYLHANEVGAPSVIMDRRDAEPIDYEFAADCAALWSNKTPCSVSQVDSVSLSAPSGQFLANGSVVMLGPRTEYSMRNPTLTISLHSSTINGMTEVVCGPYYSKIGTNTIHFTKNTKTRKILKRDLLKYYKKSTVVGILERIRC
jgi:hypothetical protein